MVQRIIFRLTGKHETAAIDDFSYGISDRGASIRIPIYTVENGWKGYLEDRRPNSSADPYKVAAVIISTVKSADSKDITTPPEYSSYMSDVSVRSTNSFTNN